MRRAITAAVMGGLVLGGAVATPSLAATRGEGKGPGKASQAVPTKPRAASKPKAASKPRAHAKPTTGMKTVVYAGYEFQVPASWPVYRLDEHPQTCVRYDVPAVYLGKPGANMRCTAGLVGRTQTVSFIPGQGAATGPVAGSPSRSAAADGADGTELQRLPAVHGAITQNAVQQTTGGRARRGGASRHGPRHLRGGPGRRRAGARHLAPGSSRHGADRTAARCRRSQAPAAETSQRARLSAERAPLARSARQPAARPRRPRPRRRRGQCRPTGAGFPRTGRSRSSSRRRRRHRHSRRHRLRCRHRRRRRRLRHRHRRRRRGRRRRDRHRRRGRLRRDCHRRRHRSAASTPAPPRRRQRCASGAAPTPPSAIYIGGVNTACAAATSPPAGSRQWPAWAGACCRPTSGRRRPAGAATGY